MKNFNLVEVINKELTKATYPNYAGGDFILAETGVLHFSYTSRAVKNATAVKMLKMDVDLGKTKFKELQADFVADFVNGKITVAGFADQLNEKPTTTKPSAAEKAAAEKAAAEKAAAEKKAGQ